MRGLALVLLALAAFAPGTAAQDDIAPRTAAQHGAVGASVREVRGVVVWPTGVPGDERASVVLRGVRSAQPRLDARWLEIARAPVAADGTFVLPAPTDLARWSVALEARYLCLEPAAGEGAELPATLRLEPVLGGFARIRLVPAAASVFDAGALAGRPLVLEHRPSGRRVTATIGADLALEAGGLAPDGTWEVRSQPGLAPFAPVRVEPFRAVPGVVREIRVPVRDGLTISGRVVDEAGAPVAGARVSIEWGGATRTTSWAAFDHAETDANGRYAFEGVHPLLRAVRASAQGFRPAVRERVTLPWGRELDGIDLALRRGLALAGIVRLPDGRPVAGATVAAVESADPSGVEEGPRVRTDDAGRFAISGLDAGPRRVVVTAAFERSPADETGAVVRVAESAWERPAWRAVADRARVGGPELELVLRAPPGLRGTVVDDAGAPVRAFTLTARSAGGASAQPDVAYERTFASESGAFDWDVLDAGRWVVAASAQDHAASEPVRVELPAEGRGARFVLPRCASVSGRVVDSNGLPVAGARVEPVELRASGAHRDEGRATRSAADGRFALDRLPPGRWRLGARVDAGLAPSEPLALVLGAGERRTDVELALRRGGRLELRVLGPDGLPAPRSPVVLGTELPSPLERGLETDSRGVLLARDLAPGALLVTARLAGPDGASELVQARVEIVADRTTSAVVGGPREVAVVVRGRVTAAGEPVEGAYVEALVGGALERPTARSASDGTFALELALGGDAWLRVRAPGGPLLTFRERVPASGEHAVRLALPTAGLRGRVTASGELAFWTRVVVRREHEDGVAWSGGVSVVDVDRETGAWTCLHLSPGKYTVFAGVDGGPFVDFAAVAGQGSALRAGVVAESGAEREGLELALGRGGRVEGRVVDARGAPVAARVYARTADGTPLQLAGVATREAGGFALGGLPAGELLLEAAGEGVATAQPLRVTVGEGATATARLVVGPATVLVLRLLGADDVVDELAVSILDPSGFEHAHPRGPALAGFDPERTERAFGPLAPGVYRVRIAAPDGRAAQADVLLAGEHERAIALVLE